MSALLVVAYICLDLYKTDLTAELSDYNYAMMEISEDAKSAFFNASSMIKTESEYDGISNSKADILRRETDQIESILNNPILLKSKSSKELLLKYDVNIELLSGQRKHNYKDIYLLTNLITLKCLDECSRLENQKKSKIEETRFLTLDSYDLNFQRNKQYKLWFRGIYITQPEEGYKYKVTYDGKEEKIYKFPYLLQGKPDSVKMDLDILDIVPGENYHVQKTFRTKDYQL